MRQEDFEVMNELENTYWWYLAKREYIRLFLSSPKKGYKILDIGCGTGGTSQYLEKFGSVIGLEKNPHAVRFSKQRGLRVVTGTASKLPFRSKTFDVVTILDVISYRGIDEMKVLSEIFRVLKPGGLLILNDSAIPWLWSYHDVVIQIKYRYTRKQLVQLVTNSHFKILRASYIYMFTLSFFILNRIYIKITKPKNTVQNIHPILNIFLLHLMSWERKLFQLTDLPLGSSVFIVAQKP